MIRVKQKLNSSRGASILLAFVLFLLCAMVSAVVVGSAMTNMQKVKNRREQQQVYYSVSSAARLLHDAMEQVSFVGSESVQTYGCTNVVVGGTDQFTFIDPAQHHAEYPASTFQAADTAQDLPLAKILQTGAQKVYMSRITYVSSNRVPFTGWSDTFIIEDGTNPVVSVKVVLDDKYNLTFTLAPQDEKWKDDYQMTFLCAGREVTPDASSVPTTCTHKVSYWDMENNQKVEEERTYDGTLTTKSTTISWIPGRILKGVSNNNG